MTTEPRCPHCQTVLPEKATFCAACGNRIEGWSVVPESEKPEQLPGGQEPTTNMQPTPSLLRAVALSKQPKAEPKPAPEKTTEKQPPATGESDSAMMRSIRRPVPIWALVLVGGAAAGMAYWFAARHAPSAPPAPVAAIPSTAPIAVAPAVVAPAAVAPPPAPHAAVQKKSARHAHRLAPLEVPSPKQKHARGGGGLPHKAVATDSKPLTDDSRAKTPRVDPAAAAAAINTANDAPAEATPQTEEEMKKEAEASIDADGIRFVVKAHLAQVHACYQRAFKDASPGGRVEIAFAITPQGTATRVRTETNSTDSPSLATCLESRVRSWQFPRPVGGDYELIYPFVFAPGS